MSKEDLVLYSLHLIKEDPHPNRDYTKDSLSNAIGISRNTLDLYMTRLKIQGMLVRYKKKYITDLRKTVDITDEGREYINRLSKNLECLLLTEQRHNIPACIELAKVMSQLPSPLEKAFFLSLYNHSKYFDLPMLINSLKISRDETNLLSVFSKMEPNPTGTSKESFIETFFNTSLYGKLDPKKLQAEEWPREDINALIVLALAKIKMGKMEDGDMILKHLHERSDLTLNQWFTSKIYRILWFMKMNQLEAATDLADELISTSDNKVMQAFARLFKADALFFRGDREQSFEQMKSTIGAFTNFGLPLFLSMGHNFRGVHHFIMEDYQEAERDWIKARKFAREAKSEFAEAKVLPNLADIAMKSGKYDLAQTYLDKCEDIFRRYSDYEGISVIELNRTLLSVERGDLKGVADHFKLCKSVAFPLPAEYMLSVYKDEISKRAKEKGISGIESML